MILYGYYDIINYVFLWNNRKGSEYFLNNYGLWAAKRRAKIKNQKEKEKANKEVKPKAKSKTEPKIEFYPIKDKMGSHDYIDWEN